MSCSGWRLESQSKFERRICKQLLRTASQWLQMTRTFFLRHPGHNSACLLRQLAAGIQIIAPHTVLRVAVAALIEVQEITTMQHVPLTDDMCLHVAVLSCGEYSAMDMSLSMASVVDANKWRNVSICEHQHMTFGRFLTLINDAPYIIYVPHVLYLTKTSKAFRISELHSS